MYPPVTELTSEQARAICSFTATDLAQKLLKRKVTADIVEVNKMLYHGSYTGYAIRVEIEGEGEIYLRLFADGTLAVLLADSDRKYRVLYLGDYGDEPRYHLRRSERAHLH